VETLSFCFDNRQSATLAAEQAGRDARELNWENNAQKHIALFESLLNGIS
jgi:hypothetical protein